MEQFAKPGEICPNPACRLHGKLQAPQPKAHIIKAGKTVSVSTSTMSSFRIVVIARSVFCDEAIPSQTRRLLRFARSDKMRRVYGTRV